VDWALDVAGDGYDMARIRRVLDRSGLSSRVVLRGWVSGSDKTRLLHEASVVVVPSLWPEAFGIVGIEAMACGRPVVAFDVGGVRDWLEDTVTGYLVPVGDAAGLASRIDGLLRDPGLASQMGKAGVERVEQRFRPERHVQTLVSLYERIL
jgi:glycosyltransferase involved in cell wall biosynthesis